MKTITLFRTFTVLGLVALLFTTGCKSQKTAQTTEAQAGGIAEAVSTAQVAAEENSALLWEITGPELTESSYLFGTIHLIGSEDFIFEEAWKNAFASSEQLVLELDMDDPGMMMKMMQGSMMSDGKSIKDLVTEEEYAALEAFFRDSVQQPLAMLGRMKPMLVTSAIYPKMINGETKSYEMVLVEMAKEKEMEILGVEGIEDQLAMVDQIPLDEQVEMLMTYVEDFPAEKARFQEMTQLYVQQDIPGLYQFIRDAPEMEAEAEEIMLKARNRKWIPVMEEMMAEKPTYFAVGAGHLWGEEGVISLLRNAGYTVTPMR